MGKFAPARTAKILNGIQFVGDFSGSADQSR
jgi:hypothetical protein